MRKSVVFLILGLFAVFAIGALAVRGFLSKAPPKANPYLVKVARGDLQVEVVDSGTIDAVKSVEVKSRVTGRLQNLYKDEGDTVKAGELVAIIDPKETRLQLQQNQAQLSGAQSAVQRQALTIDQRKATTKAEYNQAQVRVAQLELEMKAQPALTQAAINSAQSALVSAQQDRLKMIQSVHPTQLNEAKSAVAEAEANYDNSEREYKRQSDLLAQGYVSGKLADQAKLAFDLAKVRLDSAKVDLAKLSAQLEAEESKANEAVQQAQSDLIRAKVNSFQDESKRQDYLSAIADLKKAKAALQDPAIFAKQEDQDRATVSQLQSLVDDSQRQLNETEIHAPISGIVTKKGLNVGELATGLSQFSSGTTIVKIEDRRTMRVKLDINEIDVAKMSVGMSAKISVDALPNDDFTGVVRKIAPASTDSGTGTAPSADAVVRYEVEISIDNPNDKLRSGMSAKCTIEVIKKSNVLVVPVEYVEKQDSKFYVYLPSADPKGQPTKREVKVGAASGTKYEILSGVSEGESIEKPKYTGPARQGMMQAGGPD